MSRADVLQVLQDTRTPDVGGAAAITTYVYGLGLIAATDSAGGTSYFVGDGLGSTSQLADATGTTTTVYDALYRPSSVTDGAANIVGYAYDPASRRTAITYPAGTGTAAYAYDNANRLTSVTDWNNKTTGYVYDDADRLTTTNVANGVTETRAYDNADRLATILTKKNNTTIVSYTYTVDPVGNRSQVIDTTGTTTFGYDSLYRLNAVTYPNADAQSYTYDAMGNRLTKVHNGATTNYTNDDADQMTQAGAAAYTYDANGNQTAAGADTFSYNGEDRLSGTNLGGIAGSYVYNGDGLRTSRTIGATTTTFAWGNATGMPVILRDSAGNRYLYGLDLISVSDSSNKKFYYHTDGLGSTTAMTNATGAVQNTYQYDGYGAIRAQTGTQPNEFTFTGEEVDTSGLEYLRARYYDGATGRFLGRDPLPLGNRYAYVGDDPANLVDPRGYACAGAVGGNNFFGGESAVSAGCGGPLGGLGGLGGGGIILAGACALAPACMDAVGGLLSSTEDSAKQAFERGRTNARNEGRRETSPMGPPQQEQFDPDNPSRPPFLRCPPQAQTLCKVILGGTGLGYLLHETGLDQAFLRLIDGLGAPPLPGEKTRPWP
jgi:RHS repeat-associated protein